MEEHLTLATKQPDNSVIKNKQLSRSFELQLFQMYQIRLKSIMETIKIYQENLENDKQIGALAFMKSQQMATYRVDREFELLRDVLLTEKQHLVIKVLTSYHQLKKQYDYLKQQQSSYQSKSPFNKGQHQMAAQKDILINNQSFVNKQSRISNKYGETCLTHTSNHLTTTKNSNSRLSIISQGNQMTTSTSVSVYERLLQQKLTLIKDLEKKNKQLAIQNEQQVHKIGQLQKNMEIFLVDSMAKKPCEQCLALKQINLQLTKKNDLLKEQIEANQLKLNQYNRLKQQAHDQLSVKQLKIAELSTKLQNLQQQQKLHMQQQQQQKLTKPTTQSNSNTIKELKQKLILQEHQLMTVSNAFALLKQDIKESLCAQINRLRNFIQILKKNVNSYIESFKKDMLCSVADIIATVRHKSQPHKVNQDFTKRLRRIDNQLDYFMEQKHIKI